MLRVRLATAAVVLPLLLVLILYPSPWPVTVLVVATGIIGVAEYAAMAFPGKPAERALTMVLGAALLLGSAWPPSAPQAGHLCHATVVLVVIGGLAWVLLARRDFEQGLRHLGLSLIGVFYVGLLLPHFIWLHGVPARGPRLVIFVLLIGMLGDTGGYFIGRALGRHKLMPRVSPGKTIEGSLGIVAASILGGAAAKVIFLRELTWNEVVWLSAVMAVIGQLGDLCESIMKRTFGVKESGWLFPGHGGVLDRIDSLLFPVAFVYYHVVLFR